MGEPIINGVMHHVKIYYTNGRYKYANLFSYKKYQLGLEMKTIKGYRKMNFIERFLFRNCL